MALQEQISNVSKSNRHLSLPFQLATAGLAALVLTVGINLLPNFGVTDQGETGERTRIALGPVANASEALERAAVAAEGNQFVPPKPGQWIYLKHEKAAPADGPGGFATGGSLQTYQEETWTRGDGRRSAYIGDDGRVHVHVSVGTVVSGGNGYSYIYEEGIPDPLPDIPDGVMSSYPPVDYETLASIPTDPEALVEWAMSALGQKSPIEASRRDDIIYSQLVTLMRYSILPPDLEAAVYRALQRVPGVALVEEAVDVAGRPAIAIGRVQNGWLHEEVLLDRESYEYLGERTVAATDKTFEVDGERYEVKKGTIQLLRARIGSEVVDRPGQRPSN